MSTKILQVLLVLGLVLTACAPDIASPTATWTSTPKSTETATPPPSPAPFPPVLIVNVETTCHDGPGSVYNPMATLIVGDLAQVTGKDADGVYWIINNPNGDGECWIESQYATIIGEANSLALITPPPTAIPAPPSAPFNIQATVACSWSGTWRTIQKGKKEMEVVITLTWEHDSKNTDGYHIYKDDYLVGTTDASTLAYADWFIQLMTIPVPGAQYSVEAYNSIGTSPRATLQFNQTCSLLEVEFR